ncbi:MAG: FAD-dependent oxidoreductase [Thermoleophilia bacterium]|jgi:hypothetical protein
MDEGAAHGVGKVRLRLRLHTLLLTLGVFLAVFVCSIVSTAPAQAADNKLTDPGRSVQTPGPATLDVDVLVFSTQTSGLAAVRELAVIAPHLRVALVSSGNMLETPLAQGLSLEDAREIDRVSGGFYQEWRQAVITSYGRRGLSPFTSTGRLAYEPEVAADALWSLLLGGRSGDRFFFYSAHLLAAGDQGEERYADVRVEGGGVLRITTRYFIDASVEGDLARKLGADYRVGRHEAVYNDVAGLRPQYPGAANRFETAPQRFSPLLTLKVYEGGTAPRISRLIHHNYDPASYLDMGTFSSKHIEAFGMSWSMTTAVLPNGKRELNETWNDWPDVGLAFQWVFAPERRGEIRRRVLQWSINRVRYIQEHGYPYVGLATVPQKLYVREGPRFIGLDTYTVDELRADVARETVAVGCYCEYDRHDAFYPTHIAQTRYARVPMGALIVQDHPWLLVSTGVSVDCATYSSAVRMEHTRAAMGGAAAAIVAVADQSLLQPDQVPYEPVRSLLLGRGYPLDVTAGVNR